MKERIALFHSSGTFFLACLLPIPHQAFDVPAQSVVEHWGQVRTPASPASSSFSASPIILGALPPDSQADSSNGNTQRSVDEYVLNIHGGKYNFDEPSTGGTAAGRYFATALYSGSSSSLAASEKAENEKLAHCENWPKWAQRMVNVAQIPSSAEELLTPVSGEEVTIRIQNQYRTWEPYFVKLVRLVPSGTGDPDNCPYEILSDLHGKLAPKGGANEYLDWANSVIRYCGEVGSTGGEYCLVAGTEEEKWHYRLLVGP